jgi:hypothetical protein
MYICRSLANSMFIYVETGVCQQAKRSKKSVLTKLPNPWSPSTKLALKFYTTRKVIVVYY